MAERAMATLTDKPLTTGKGAAAAAAEDRRDAYVADFETFRAARPPSEPGFVAELRRRAIERFAELGFPTLDQEAWRKTDVRPVAQGAFARAAGPSPVPEAVLAPHVFAGAWRLVFVDGFLAPELSQLDGLPDGVRLGGLAAALEAEPESLEPYLGRHAKFDQHPFVALNTAFFADGAVLHVPRGTVLERPVHLLHLSTVAGDGEPVAAFPRNLIVAGEASQVTVLETFAAFGAGRYFDCPVTEIVAEPGAVVDHYKVQHEAREAFHLATLQVHQERDSNFFSHAISAGGDVTRNDVNAWLGGPGIE